MASKDLFNGIAARQCLAAQTLSATATGTAVDTATFESVTGIINAGAGLTATNKLTVSLVEGDTAGTLTDVAAEDYLGSGPFDITATGSYKIGYRGVKQYVAIKLTVTGTVSTPVGASIILSHPTVEPTV
jgi:hypothetical protein